MSGRWPWVCGECNSTATSYTEEGARDALMDHFIRCHVEPKKVPSSPDYDLSIHSNPDARAWADLFAGLYAFPPKDVMIGWFANAMMAMHDHLKRKETSAAPPASLSCTCKPVVLSGEVYHHPTCAKLRPVPPAPKEATP